MRIPLTLVYAAAVALAAGSLALSTARAEKQTPIELPTAEEIEDAIPEGGSLTGREIYERFLENKMHTAVQWQTVISRDPSGDEQSSTFWVRWKDYRDLPDSEDENVLAKTLVKFQKPHDMRHTGYLMIMRKDRGSDQFVYRPSSRKVRRVKLRGVTVMGSDFTFDDIAFQNIEDADYTRLPDEEIDGVPVYVVEARMKPFVSFRYVRAIAYIEKEHYVPLRVRYFDENDVEFKEMRAEPDSLKEFDGVWVATNATMHDLRQGTSSQLLIEKLDPNPELAEQLFSTFRLRLRR